MNESNDPQHEIVFIGNDAGEPNGFFDLLEESNCHVWLAPDAEAGIRRTRLIRPDLIILKVTPDDTDGFDICHRLKQTRQTRNIPVVFFGETKSVNEKLKGFEKGGIDFWTKPFHFKEIKARLTAILSIRQQLKNLTKRNETLQNEIAERKQAEILLRESKKNLETLFNSLDDFLFVLDIRGQIINVNSIVLTRLGYPETELNNTAIFHLYPEPRRREAMVIYLEKWEVDKKFCDIPLLDRQGTQVPVESAIYRGRWNNEDAIFNISRDISERLSMERRIHEQEIERLMRIEDKMSSLGRVSAGIAHEIRNPLSVINVYLSTLKGIVSDQDWGNEEKPRMIEDVVREISDASQKIETVIRRVMDFSKPNPPRRNFFNLNRCVQDAVALSTVTLRKKEVNINTELEKDLPDSFFDAQSIIQVLLNLIANAQEAMRNKEGEKNIFIQTDYNDRFLYVTVADNGPGVMPGDREKIFDPFYTTKYDGSGIGLTIGRRIISDHGGSIVCSQSAMGGAEFTMQIPFAELEKYE